MNVLDKQRYENPLQRYILAVIYRLTFSKKTFCAFFFEKYNTV